MDSKKLKTISVSQTGRKSFPPDTVEFSVQVETVAEKRDDVIKRHAPKSSSIITLTGEDSSYDSYEAYTTLQPIIGETRSGVKVVEKYRAVTTARYRSTDFNSIMLATYILTTIEGGRSVFDVEFKLANMEAASNKLLQEIGAAVLTKLEVVAKSMSLNLGSPVEVDIGKTEIVTDEPAPHPRSYRSLSAAPESSVGAGYEASELSKTIVKPRQIKLEATIRATYSLAN